MSSATVRGHAASSCGGALKVHQFTVKGRRFGVPCSCFPPLASASRRRNLHKTVLASSCTQGIKTGLECNSKGQRGMRLGSRGCMQIGQSAGWHGQSSIHQRRSRLHASTDGGDLRESSAGEEEAAPETQDGGVDEEQHAAEKTAGDTGDTQGSSHLRATAKRIAYQAKLLKYKGWIHDPAESDAHNRWVPVVRDKEQGPPLIAMIGLTAGSVVLAIILALQGWNRVRHRVPNLPMLPFVSKWHPVAEPQVEKSKEVEKANGSEKTKDSEKTKESEKTKDDEPANDTSEQQGTRNSATSPSKQDSEREHAPSTEHDEKKAAFLSKEHKERDDVSSSQGDGKKAATGAQSGTQVSANEEPKKGVAVSKKSEEPKQTEKKRGGGNFLTALFKGHGKKEAEKEKSHAENLELEARRDSNEGDTEEESKSGVAQGLADAGKTVLAKGAEVVDVVKEKVVGGEEETSASDNESHSQQTERALDQEPQHGQQQDHASEKEAHSRPSEPKSSEKLTNQSKDHAPDKKHEKHASAEPLISLPVPEKQSKESREKHSEESHQKGGDLHQETKGSLLPLKVGKEAHEEQAKSGRPESRLGEEHGDEPAPVVLQPAVNVVALTGGDGRRAPPSSPSSAGGAETPAVIEVEKGAVPTGILKAAADMLKGPELEEQDWAGSLVQSEGNWEQQGSEQDKGENNQVKTGVSEEGQEDDQVDEGLSNTLKGIWPTVEFFEEGGEMEFGDGGVAKDLGFVPLPIAPLQTSSPAKLEVANSTGHDERRPSLAGGADATVEDPPARRGPVAGAPSGGESFQDWYAKQWNGRGSGEGGSGGTEQRPPQGELKPSAYVDTAQLQALQALQKLNVVDEDVEPTAVCTRRDFARWLLAGSRVLTGSPGVFPVPSEGVTEAAFDDVTPDDKDFGAIQGLAEAGILPSRLSSPSTSNFQPDEPVTRQDLVRWKLALDRRRFPTESDAGRAVFDAWGFTDIDLIDADALPALLADFQAGDQSVVARAFGYTLRFQPQKQASVAQAAAALAAGSAADTVAERVSEMEAYRAADEVFREEVREQREIIEAVAARGEEIVKNLEEDKGTLAETRAAVEEAIKELDAHRDAIRRESEQLAQSVDSARAIIEELTSVHSVSEAERNTLQAELQRLDDGRADIERVTSEAEAQIGAELRKARAAVEGLEEVRETLKAEAEGRSEGGSFDKPLVEFFDEGMEAAGDRPRNILKRAMRGVKYQLHVAKGHLARLRESSSGHVSKLRESTSGHVSNLQSGSADVMASLKEKTGQVAEAGSGLVREVPDKAREVVHRTVPPDVRENVRRTSSKVWARVREALIFAWEALVRVWHYIEAFLKVVVDRVKGGLERIQRKVRHSSA